MPKVIHWFRQDLRLQDNPALSAAVAAGDVIPVYILDDVNPQQDAMGAASKVWLHHALTALDQSLGGHLCLYQGDPLTILGHLCRTYDIQALFWNRCYEPWSIQRDSVIKQQLKNVEVKSFNASLLWEPWKVSKEDGSTYQVFTPFYKACLKAKAPRTPIAKPLQAHFFKDDTYAVDIKSLALLPHIPWDTTICREWNISEQGAHDCLQHFIEHGLYQYKEGRDFPALQAVSRLSPYLHYGEISPHTVWHTIRQQTDTVHVEHFCRELVWREFSYSLLYTHPTLPHQNLHSKFDRFPWIYDEKKFSAWTQGRTGIPMVDAGMRQLWQTGYMHNRVRMIVASFLVKNLLIHWKHGERWFWDCLFDADLANNSASWQWVAGCGADAAPYFRVFNPITQGEKFDPEGSYIRRFVPELQQLPDEFLFQPWNAPSTILRQAGVTLGKTYPYPIVDITLSRQQALQAFETIKQ